MITGATLTFWISFHLIVATLLFVDLVLLQSSPQAEEMERFAAQVMQS